MKVIVIDEKHNVIEEWKDILSVEVVGRKIRLVSYCTTPCHFTLNIQNYRYQIVPEYKEK